MQLQMHYTSTRQKNIPKSHQLSLFATFVKNVGTAESFFVVISVSSTELNLMALLILNLLLPLLLLPLVLLLHLLPLVLLLHQPTYP